ncbi:MAG TPA: FKBP-type peptidyl-prolyl cis-trans isomerase [Opitutaceae bacterium]|nr:FKBP-type peptidyl-prolyl cis-trans isomerase [Opitutaceae bacterium]
MRTFGFAALACVLLLPTALRAQRERLSPDEVAYVEKTWPNAKKTSTGIRYVIERQGHGQPPNPGDKVFVLYVGKLLNGHVFDKVQDPNNPFTFRVDRYSVIEGWDQTMETMKVGEKRLVVIPSELAYGTTGQRPNIPPDSALIFEIELLKIERVQ